MNQLHPFLRPKVQFIFWSSFLVLSTLIIRLADLDMAVSKFAYNFTNGFLENDGWVLFIYRMGQFPLVVVFMLALAYLVRSLSRPEDTFKVSVAKMTSLSVIIGPGLIVNGLFKNLLPRNRPYDLEIFGKDEVFQPLGVFGGIGESFSSGHAAAVFSLSVLVFFFLRNSYRTQLVVYLLILLLGVGMSALRIFQGGHFLSDCVWSLGITQLVNAGLFAVLKPNPYLGLTSPRWSSKIAGGLGNTVALAIVLIGVFGFLQSFHAYYYKSGALEIKPGTRKIVLYISGQGEKVVLGKTASFKIGYDYLVLTNAFPWTNFNFEPEVNQEDGVVYLNYEMYRTPPYFGDYSRLRLDLPQTVKLQIENPNEAIVEYAQ